MISSTLYQKFTKNSNPSERGMPDKFVFLFNYADLVYDMLYIIYKLIFLLMHESLPVTRRSPMTIKDKAADAKNASIQLSAVITNIKHNAIKDTARGLEGNK